MSWKKLPWDDEVATLSDNVPNTIEPDDTASAGVAAGASRDDHEHAIVTAIPSGDVAESATAAEGTGTSFVRDDHVHNAPATWAPTAHLLGGHTTDTLVNLNAVVMDATLDDSSDSRTPSAHEASHKDGGSDEILLNEFGNPTGSVEINKQEVLNLVFEQQSTEPGTPTQGQVYYDTDDDHLYVYVAS